MPLSCLLTSKQVRLHSIAGIISQAMQEGDISSTEFHKVLQELEQDCKLKTAIRNQAETKVRQITKEQREELLEQGRKEGKHCKYFRYPGCQYHLKHESTPPYSMCFYGLQGL